MTSEESAAVAALPRLRSLVATCPGLGLLDGACVRLLADALQQHAQALESVRLRCESVDAAGAAALAAFIQHSRTLTSLDLMCWFDGDDEHDGDDEAAGDPAAVLFAAVGQSGSLRRLRLSHTPVTAAAAAALASALALSRSLTELDIQDCKMDEAAMAALAPSVAASPTLQRLELSRNALGTADAEALAAALPPAAASPTSHSTAASSARRVQKRWPRRCGDAPAYADSPLSPPKSVVLVRPRWADCWRQRAAH